MPFFNFQEQLAPPEPYSAPSQGHSFRVQLIRSSWKDKSSGVKPLSPYNIKTLLGSLFSVDPFSSIFFYLPKGRGVLKKLKKTNDLNGFPQQDSWRPLHHLSTGNQTQVPQHLLLQLLEIRRYTLNLNLEPHSRYQESTELDETAPYAYGTLLNMHKQSYARSFSTFQHSLPAFRTPALRNEMFQSSKTCDKSRRESASQSKAWQFMTNLCLEALEKRKPFDELVTGEFNPFNTCIVQWCTLFHPSSPVMHHGCDSQKQACLSPMYRQWFKMI